MIRALVALLCALPFALDAQEITQEVREPATYRMSDYRAAVPATLAGAVVVDTETARRMWQAQGARFVDVLPRASKPANLPEGTIWRDKPRLSLPGAVWLPNVGYGALDAQMQHYFQSGLQETTAGDPTQALVMFCRRDCWMSWNAAKRALEYGYVNVFWFPDGSDGWQEAGHALEEIQPLTKLPEQQ